MNDLRPYKHGDEGTGSTHAVCNKHNIGTASVCCECSGKTDCADERLLTSMNKPCCCELCRVEDWEKTVSIRQYKCGNLSCPCHLPKEKCECAEPLILYKGCCSFCHRCYLPIRGEEVHAWSGAYLDADLSIKECECGNSFPHKQPPAPEKKWEESFDKTFTLGRIKWNSYERVSNDIKSFIASLLEEQKEELMKQYGDKK